MSTGGFQVGLVFVFLISPWAPAVPQQVASDSRAHILMQEGASVSSTRRCLWSLLTGRSQDSGLGTEDAVTPLTSGLSSCFSSFSESISCGHICDAPREQMALLAATMFCGSGSPAGWTGMEVAPSAPSVNAKPTPFQLLCMLSHGSPRG